MSEPTKTITLTVKQWRQILTAVERYNDQGCQIDQWQSEPYKKTAMRLTIALDDAPESLPPSIPTS